jgi:WhiB family redox-sensing transcriptional regulator
MTVLLSDEWWDLAACKNAEPELFFPISVTSASRGTIERAKRVCGSCPVQSQCLSYALRHRQEQGIWGGLTEDERRRLNRRMATSERAASRSAAIRTRAGVR